MGDETGFVTDTAGRVFIHFQAGNIGEIDAFAAVEQQFGHDADFLLGHAGVEGGHEKGGHLVVRYFSARIPFYEVG